MLIKSFLRNEFTQCIFRNGCNPDFAVERFSVNKAGSETLIAFTAVAQAGLCQKLPNQSCACQCSQTSKACFSRFRYPIQVHNDISGFRC